MDNRLRRNDRGVTRTPTSRTRGHERALRNDLINNLNLRQPITVAPNTSIYQQMNSYPNQSLLGLRQENISIIPADNLTWPESVNDESSQYDFVESDKTTTAGLSWQPNPTTIFSPFIPMTGPFPNHGTMMPKTSSDQFSTVSTGTLASGSGSARGRLTVKLDNGAEVPAIFHRDRYPSHRKLNQTMYEETTTALQRWDVDETGERPIITYDIDERQDARSRASYAPWKDTDGRIVVNSDKKPLRASIHLPETVSTKIEGWRMELIMRLDPSVTWDDFLDRMPDRSPLFSRTCASSLQSRRRKDISAFEFRPRPRSGTSPPVSASSRHIF